jgi:hypothetical protein
MKVNTFEKEEELKNIVQGKTESPFERKEYKFEEESKV